MVIEKHSDDTVFSEQLVNNVGWLRRSKTSPVTNVRLASKQLLLNHALERAIEECIHENEQRLDREKQALVRRVESSQIQPRGQGRVKVGVSAWLPWLVVIVYVRLLHNHVSIGEWR